MTVSEHLVPDRPTRTKAEPMPDLTTDAMHELGNQLREIAALKARVAELTPRVIDNPEDLDTLPIGTVVINDGGQVAQRYDGMGGWWQVLDGDQLDSADLIGTGWVKVLHTPAGDPR